MGPIILENRVPGRPPRSTARSCVRRQNHKRRVKPGMRLRAILDHNDPLKELRWYDVKTQHTSIPRLTESSPSC